MSDELQSDIRYHGRSEAVTVGRQSTQVIGKAYLAAMHFAKNCPVDATAAAWLFAAYQCSTRLKRQDLI